MAKQIREYKFTGAAGIVASTVATGGLHNEQVLEISIHLSVAPTSHENLVISLDYPATAYDSPLVTIDLASVPGTTEILWVPDGDLVLLPLEYVRVAYTNTDVRTYGIVIKTEEV